MTDPHEVIVVGGGQVGYGQHIRSAAPRGRSTNDAERPAQRIAASGQTGADPDTGMTIHSGTSATAEGAMVEDRVRVVIAEDSVLLRDGIARLLEQAGFDVVGQAGDGEDLLRKVGAHKPDVAVIDVRMPPAHTDEGLQAARRIRAEHPDTAVLVLSQYVEEAYALDLLSESTERTGYLLKDRIADVESFTDAVRRVARGGSALDPEVVALLLGRRRRTDPLAALTPREREVLGLMAEGRSNSAMADALVVSDRAIEKHVTAILSKLDLPPAAEDHRRVLAVLAFLRSA
jgi:DNA-binding NarL/FixJ family response regulator